MLTRELIGYPAVAAGFLTENEMSSQLFTESLEQSHAIVLQSRPDLAAARRSAVPARSQKALAKANAKQELTTGEAQQMCHAAGVTH